MPRRGLRDDSELMCAAPVRPATAQLSTIPAREGRSSHETTRDREPACCRTWRGGTETAKHSKYERSNLEYGTQFCGLPMTDSYRYKTTEDEHAEIRRRGNGTPVVRASAAPRDTVARSSSRGNPGTACQGRAWRWGAVGSDVMKSINQSSELGDPGPISVQSTELADSRRTGAARSTVESVDSDFAVTPHTRGHSRVT